MAEVTIDQPVKQNAGVITAGLALFSMFFGAGDLIWPLILGGDWGDKNLYAMLGLLVTGVSLPLLGLLAMMLFNGNYASFFGRIGRVPGVVLIFVIQFILGPVGSIPRLIALSFSTLKPYLPSACTLIEFSIGASLVLLLFTIKKRRVIDLLGAILTPLLLVSLGSILLLGFWHPPAAFHIELSRKAAFSNGISVGYNTLDLIASFIFAPLVLSHFVQKESPNMDPQVAQRTRFKRMLKASLLAATLLTLMYVGLTYVASFYTPFLTPGHIHADRLAEISRYLLGPYGAFFSCIAVAMACLTTAIPLVAINATYIQKELCRDKLGTIVPLILTLLLSGTIANLGFAGIAQMLDPVLGILCPGLIVLSLLNICYKLYNMAWSTLPVYAAFTISTGVFVASKF